MDHFQDRRNFLKLTGASLLSAAGLGAQQEPPAMPGPKQARVTSSIMIWILKGTMEEKLGKVAEIGIQSAELVSEYRTWSDADAERYVKLARPYGFGFDTIMAQTNWAKEPNSMVNPDHRERFLKELNEAIVWAKKFNVPQILLMSGNDQPGMTQDAQFASLVESGKRAADLAAAKAVQQVDNPHFRQLFDIYHEFVQHGDPIAAIVAAEPYVSVFHVADAPGRHDPGTGQMKWDEIYKAIGKSGYSGYIALEYIPAGDEVQSLIKAVKQMRTDLNASAMPA